MNNYGPNRGFQLRVGIIFFLFCAAFTLIVMRLFLLQIGQQKYFMSRAVLQRQVCMEIAPARAPICDRNGVPIALSVRAKSAFITPRHVTNKDTLCAFLAQYYPAVLSTLQQGTEKPFIWVQRALEHEFYQRLVAKRIPDLYWLDEYKRVYNYPSVQAVLGSTDVDLVGTDGLELMYQDRLAGTPSTVLYERDARSSGLYAEQIILHQGCQGNPLHLTLDVGLSEQVYQELIDTVAQLGAQQAAAVIMDPYTGAVYVMTTYNPPLPPENSLQRASNAVACQPYEPGSALKPFLALAALEEGVIKPDEEIDCQGKVAWINGVRVENWKSVDHINLSQIVVKSSNVGTAKVAHRLGARFYDHLARLGFGTKTGIELPGEAPGFLNHPSRWTRPSLIVLSFGYEMMTTLMQLACAYSILANGGYSVQPTLLLDSVQRPHNRVPLYQEESIKEVQSYLTQIGLRYPVDDFQVMGKTGTTRCVENGKYVTTAHNYTFAGIVRKGDYARVVVTFIARPVKHSLWASETAAPLFARIARRMVARDVGRDLSRGLSGLKTADRAD